MKIIIPKVVVPVSMADYSPKLEGKFFYVWVNPPKRKLQTYDELVTSLQSEELKAAQQALFPEKESGQKEDSSSLLKNFGWVGRWLALKRRQNPNGVDPKILEWYAEIWNQCPADMGWTVEELQTIEAEDPAFLSWMITATWRTRTEHIERKKKV